MPSNNLSMPKAWHAPKGFLAHSLFTVACLYAIGERDLVAFWVSLEAHDGWFRFHERHHALLIPVMTMVSVSAFFINRSLTAPLKTAGNNPGNGCRFSDDISASTLR